MYEQKIYIFENRLKSIPHYLYIISSYLTLGYTGILLDDVYPYEEIWFYMLVLISSYSVNFLYNAYIFLRIKKHVNLHGIPEREWVYEYNLEDIGCGSSFYYVLYLMHNVAIVLVIVISFYLLGNTFPDKLDRDANLLLLIFIYTNNCLFLLLCALSVLILFLVFFDKCCVPLENYMTESQNLDRTNQMVINYLQTIHAPNPVTNYLVERFEVINRLRVTRRAGFCAICQTSEPGVWKVLPCHTDHRFHENCIDEWLGAGNGCPICREDPIDNIPQLSEVSTLSTNSSLSEDNYSPNQNNGRINDEMNASYDNVSFTSSSLTSETYTTSSLNSLNSTEISGDGT